MQKDVIRVTAVLFLLGSACYAAEPVMKEKQIPQSTAEKTATQKTTNTTLDSFGSNAFTGRSVGNGVRVRLAPDVESSIVKELAKDELLIVTGEKSDFYVVEAPSDLRAYIFRTFVLENVVEGNHVNVRLAPELNAPIIGSLNTGDRVDSKVAEKNHKWLEISPPKAARFFVAKEFIEKVGNAEVKSVYDEKYATLAQLIQTCETTAQTEMAKAFEEIQIDDVTQNYQTIIKDYSEFKEQVEHAKTQLFSVQEKYLQKKLAFLESKASKAQSSKATPPLEITTLQLPAESLDNLDVAKAWEKIEDTIYLSWCSGRTHKTIDDFYAEQKTTARKISGIVEPYADPIKHKPGDYVLKDRDVPKAYLYSTQIDLSRYVGKYVTLVSAPRANNNFAFPAYFVLNVE